AGGLQSESSPLNLSSIAAAPGNSRRDLGSGRSHDVSERLDVDDDDASVDFDTAFETAQ
ncbi:unnamed protein product, partial [Symbiodinium pilosum]